MKHIVPGPGETFSNLPSLVPPSPDNLRRAIYEMRYVATLDEQDAQIERLSRRLANAEIELTQTLRILQTEQKAYLKLMNRICDALGSWVGCWDNAAVEAIKRSKK
jgi:hypothetical protein